MLIRSKMKRGWVVPTVEGTRFCWRFGDTRFDVDAACGARITRFSIDGDDILTGPDVNPLNFGSTLWTSPQSQWGWPPPVAIDSLPYGAVPADATGAAVRMMGQADAGLGIAVAKTFAADAGKDLVTIDYALVNQGPEARTVAPWEISRHPTNGLTFFPADGPSSAAGPGVGPVVDPRSNLAVVESAEAVWFDYHAPAITDHQKLFARGHHAEGWIAHVDRARRLILVKTFAPVEASRTAPGEAGIEIYADPNHTYVEVEQQGAFEPLPPGTTTHWSVTWRLRRLPRSIEIRVANPELLATARALAAE